MSLARLIKRRRRLPASALFSGLTAAWLHGLDVAPCDPIEVTLPQDSTTSHLAGAVLTRSDFDPEEVCEARGLPATSRTRTVADVTRRGALIDAVVLLDMALRAKLVSLDDLRLWAGSHPRHRGLGRLQRAMDLSDPRSESPMETRLRVHLVVDGLPRPYVQEEIRDTAGALLARADLFFPEARLVIEYDGVGHRNTIPADNRRQNRLIEAGYRILRFTAGDILHTPAAVVGQARRAIELYSIGSPN